MGMCPYTWPMYKVCRSTYKRAAREMTYSTSRQNSGYQAQAAGLVGGERIIDATAAPQPIYKTTASALVRCLEPPIRLTVVWMTVE
jgi:hypothetical protein